jgi:hypothetical protein
MSFLSEASLAMIPSGYKTSKVYSALPITGDGDLTFSRSNDTATRVGPDGLIEKVRTNQVQQSETFDNAYWTKTNLSVTANAIANPLDGALTAELLTVTDPSGPVEKTILNGNQSYTAGTPYTISAYFKAGTISTDFRILAFDDVTLYQSGIIDLATIGNSTAPYEDVGGGWYRFRFTFTPANSTATGLVYLVNYAFGIAANAGTNVYVYGAQIETGDIATDYIATTSAAVSVGPVANVPRLDYLDSSSPRLLLEPQRTNLITFSEQFDNAGWTKLGITVAANNTTSPSGYIDADKLIADAGTGNRVVYQGVIPVGVSTTTVYAKAGEFGGIVIASGTQGGFFDLTTGAYRTEYNSAPTAYNITSASNGWYRCSVTMTSVSGDNLYIGPNDNVSTSLSLTGDGTSGMYAWGAQLEAGAYATSYINTLGASVTRGVDSASKTGISSLIGQTEGTLFAEFNFDERYDVSGIIPIVIRTSNNEAYIFVTTAGSLLCEVVVGGVPQASISGSIGAVGIKKVAFGYKQNDFVVYLNGVQVGTNSSGTVGAMADLNVGSYHSSGISTMNGVNQALLFKTRLSNADLASLTSL